MKLYLRTLLTLSLSLGGWFLAGCQGSSTTDVVDPTSETTPSTEVVTPGGDSGSEGTLDGAKGEAAVAQDAETTGTKPQPLAAAQVVIGGVSLAMNEAEVRAVLGEPQAMSESESACCGWLRELTYPQMTLGFVVSGDWVPDSPDLNQSTPPSSELMTLYALFTTDPSVVTNRGIQVGSSRQAVIEAYGPPAFETMTTRHGSPEEEPKFPALYYTVEYGGSWLAFVLDENNQVVEIVRDEQLN